MSGSPNNADHRGRGRSGAKTATLAFVLLVACATALQFMGPLRGWCGRVIERLSEAVGRERGTDASPSSRDALAGTTLPPPPGRQVGFLDDGTQQERDQPKQPPDATPATEGDSLGKSELERQYEELLATYLKELKSPSIGDKVRFRLRDGSRAEGVLDQVTPGRVALRVKYGVMTYALHQIHASSLDKLFPERMAQRLALQELKRLREEKTADTRIDSGPTAGPSTVVAAQERAPSVAPQPAAPSQAPVTPSPSARVRYDTSAARTPSHLKVTVQAFGRWLEMQHRRVGGRVAQKVHAKQQGQSVVLYLVMDPLFLAQDYDTRFRLAEGIYQFWAFRCEANGVIQSLADAHIVLLAEGGNIVGGSRPDSSADIWVSTTTTGPMARR